MRWRGSRQLPGTTRQLRAGDHPLSQAHVSAASNDSGTSARRGLRRGSQRSSDRESGHPARSDERPRLSDSRSVVCGWDLREAAGGDVRRHPAVADAFERDKYVRPGWLVARDLVADDGGADRRGTGQRAPAELLGRGIRRRSPRRVRPAWNRTAALWSNWDRDLGRTAMTVGGAALAD
jgi:hypothetical protein